MLSTISKPKDPIDPNQKEEIVSLIDGRFDAKEAREVLLKLINFKINFHEQKIFEFDERFGMVNEPSVMRLKELKESRRKLFQIVQNAEQNGEELIIESNIRITSYKR